MNKTAEPKKKKFKPGILDIIIIILAVACVAGVAIRYNLSEKITTSKSDDSAEISFLVKDVANTTADAIKPGDSFRTDAGTLIGTVKSVEVSKAEKYVENADGTISLSKNDLRCDIRFIITATGSDTSDGFMLGGTSYIAAGKELKIRSLTASVTSIVTGVSVLK